MFEKMNSAAVSAFSSGCSVNIVTERAAKKMSGKRFKVGKWFQVVGNPDVKVLS